MNYLMTGVKCFGKRKTVYHKMKYAIYKHMGYQNEKYTICWKTGMNHLSKEDINSFANDRIQRMTEW